MRSPVAVRPIFDDADLQATLFRLDEIFHAKPGTAEGDERAVLAVLIQAYEREHHSVDGPVDPVEAIRFYMDRLNLSAKDLMPYLGA